MRKVSALGAIIGALIVVAPATARQGWRPVIAHQAMPVVTQPPCPAGVPVQTITVVNQAQAHPGALAKVERASVAQSLQLHAAWGTPCVQFGPGGWPLHLLMGGASSVPQHDYPNGKPALFVYTTGLTYQSWSAVFSHELLESLVDPTTTNIYYLGTTTVTAQGLGGGEPAEEQLGGSIEVADPVAQRGYKLDGVWVSDFVYPAYFAGALLEQASGCDPLQGVACGPPIAPAAAPGPYDEMHILAAPWQTKWGEDQ